MTLTKAKTINDIILMLEEIIQESIEKNSTQGYFAALYHKVTIKVKEGIENNFFEDGPRMEKLDIIFAIRYIDAYNSWKNRQPVTQSWEKAFLLAEKGDPIVLQHLLIGMNAHINLDLGIAAAEISNSTNISQLQTDFNKINQILSAQVNDIQIKLVSIWPFLGKILKKTGLIDNLIVDFSMELAREGAWKFATELALLKLIDRDAGIQTRDKRIAEKTKIVTNPGVRAQIILWIIRLGERGSVAEKIEKLRHQL
ncbi:MAG: hypothetical protein JXR61_04325 [Prolixibacteraceae bacterium]|nr:hypothetical protein [Prolixibacteraceae bacterium]